jgi:hypothetical protein
MNMFGSALEAIRGVARAQFEMRALVRKSSERPVVPGTPLQRDIEFVHGRAAYLQAVYKDRGVETSAATLGHLIKLLTEAASQGKLDEALEGLRLLSYRNGLDRSGGIPAQLFNAMTQVNAYSPGVFPDDFINETFALFQEQANRPNKVRAADEAWAKRTREQRYPGDVMAAKFDFAVLEV